MKSKGFSLMELLIALVIISVIASIAYPKYQKMVKRSKQTEVRNIMKSIYMAQDIYFTTHTRYASDLSDLDIELPSNMLYQYSLSTSDTADEFLVTAKANIDADEALDQWTINQNNQLINTINDVIEE